MKKLSALRAFQTGAIALLVSGCFSYVPAEPTAVPVGGEVRLHLTRQAFAELPEIPQQTGSTLKGTLVRVEREQVLLRVPVAVQTVGLVTRTLGQDLAIPTGHIARFEERELDRVRTGLTLASGVVAVGILIATVRGTRSPASDRIRDEGDQEGGGLVWTVRIPLLSRH